MKSFFKFTLASIVGVIISSVLLFFIFVGIFSAIVSSTQDKEVKLKDNTLLIAKFNRPISERGNDNPFENFNFADMSTVTVLGLNDIINNIDKAKTDDKIKGIYLDLSIIPAGIGTIEEIRNALLDFKESGKFIISYADFYSQGAYYLATAGNKIYLNPEGVVDYRGLRAEVMFIKGTLKKLGIEPQVLKVGKFKSAVEPLILDKMSEANKEQVKKYMGSIWNFILEGISAQRKIAVNELNTLADNLTISSADSALKYNLIDGLKYKDEIISELKDSLKIEKDKIINSVSMSKYTNVPKSKRKGKGLAKDKIAIIYAQGDIVTGNGEMKQIGSDKISKAIRQAREDKKIKAIVFRINSPGGSALASEIIWREVKLAAEVKPVIASMSDVAASGGYYIACAADTIVAHENTITGSIGVFGVLFNSKELLNKKLGITVDRVKTNKHSDYGTITRALDPVERSVIQKEIESIYDTFISHVADGRNMTKEKVNEIGQGRVWSGINAKEIGLVDVFGGMNKAIEIAADRAGLDNYRIVNLPKQKSTIEQIVSELTGETKARILENELGESYKYYESLKNCLSQEGILARVPYNIDIY
ncbi:MAG: signal peptide peptidase SppA [Chlorobi bacterium]|nr:signal peptide peptidase SppA [Chlorobiota bacterium]